MTYDRNYTWSKEVDGELATVARRSGFTIVKTSEVSVDSIKLPIERAIKIKIQKALSRIHLMNYGLEFGERILLKSSKPKEMISCKVWILDDYVIGLEIKYNNIERNTVTKLNREFEKQFYNYKIVWTN